MELVPSWSCLKVVYKPVWHIQLLSVQWINYWWRTEELSETCRVSCQNKNLVVYYKEIRFLIVITFTLSVKFLGTTQIWTKWTLEFLHSLVDQHMPHKLVLAIECPWTVLEKQQAKLIHTKRIKVSSNITKQKSHVSVVIKVCTKLAAKYLCKMNIYSIYWTLS